MRAIRCATLALVLTSAVSSAKYDPPPMPVGYDDPGPVPTHVAEQIVANLRTTLKDPYSIKGLSICESNRENASPPHRKHDDWKPANWTVIFGLNAKSSYGGYTGQHDGMAWFRAGKLTRVEFNEDEATSQVDVDMREITAKLLASCEHVSDDQVQRFVQAGG